MDKDVVKKPTKKNKYAIKGIENISSDERIASYENIIKADDFVPIKTISVDLSEHREFYLLVLNDIHIGAPGCNIDKLIRYLKTVKSIPNCYIILNGDLMNNANNLGKSSPLENALSPMNEQKVIHTLLSDPVIKEKIICSTSGNHESGARAKDSGLDALVTPMATLGMLEKYARYMARLNIKVRCPYTTSGYANFKVLVRHGSGMGGNAGKIIENMFNKEKSFGDYDMIVEGHTHKNVFAFDDEIIQQPKGSIKKTVTPINVPSLEEASQYAMDAAYPPPNTDNSLIAVRAELNLDALDPYLNEGFQVLPYKFNIDTVSLDRPDLVKLSEQDLSYRGVIENEELVDIAEKIAKRVTLMAKRNKVGRPKNTTNKLKGTKNGAESGVSQNNLNVSKKATLKQKTKDLDGRGR